MLLKFLYIYLDPELHSIIRAIEIQYGDKLQYGGEYSLYLLGIYYEKPKNIIYLGNTRAKRIRIFTHDIIIKPTKIPVTKNKNDPHILAIQSLIYIGRKNITIDVTTNILEKLDNKEFIKFKKIMKFSPVWASNYLNKLV